MVFAFHSSDKKPGEYRCNLARALDHDTHVFLAWFRLVACAGAPRFRQSLISRLASFAVPEGLFEAKVQKVACRMS